MAPGLIIQFPVGNPLNSRLPVEMEQEGCEFIVKAGAVGVTG